MSQATTRFSEVRTEVGLGLSKTWGDSLPSDRDLSDYYVLTGGGRFEWRGEAWSAYVDASAMDTVYSDYLFLTSRFALVVQGGLRWQR